MAAGAGVDLLTAARFCRVPYKTLARWSKQWQPIGHANGRRLYDFDVIAAAVAAREERAAA